MNELFVCVKVDREERPDVDALYMEAVQAMIGQGGWPLERLPDPRAGAVLRRHVLSADTAPRDAGLAPGPAAVDEAWRPGATRSAIRASGWRRASRAARCSRRRPSRSPRPSWTPRWPRCAELRQRQRRLGRRAEVPGGVGRSSCCSRARSPTMALQTLRSMAVGGIFDQVGGGFSPLRGRRDVDGARTSRRCSTTTRCSPARTCTACWSAATDAAAHVRGDARLRAARAARARGRLLQRARRRLGGRRGQVLHVDASTSCAR